MGSNHQPDGDIWWSVTVWNQVLLAWESGADDHRCSSEMPGSDLKWSWSWCLDLGRSVWDISMCQAPDQYRAPTCDWPSTASLRLSPYSKVSRPQSQGPRPMWHGLKYLPCFVILIVISPALENCCFRRKLRTFLSWMHIWIVALKNVIDFGMYQSWGWRLAILWCLTNLGLARSSYKVQILFLRHHEWFMLESFLDMCNFSMAHQLYMCQNQDSDISFHRPTNDWKSEVKSI